MSDKAYVLINYKDKLSCFEISSNNWYNSTGFEMFFQSYGQYFDDEIVLSEDSIIEVEDIFKKIKLKSEKVRILRDLKDNLKKGFIIKDDLKDLL